MAWAPIAVAAVQAVGSVVSGVSQHAAAKSAAAVDRQNAELAAQEGRSQAAMIRQNAARQRGANVAAAGASGVDLSGSFTDALLDSDINAELDAQTAEWNSKVEASNYRARARQSATSGSSDLLGGVFGAGSKALQAYGAWNTPSPSGGTS